MLGFTLRDQDGKDTATLTSRYTMYEQVPDNPAAKQWESPITGSNWE